MVVQLISSIVLERQSTKNVEPRHQRRRHDESSSYCRSSAVAADGGNAGVRSGPRLASPPPPFRRYSGRGQSVCTGRLLCEDHQDSSSEWNRSDPSRSTLRLVALSCV